jgi:hypothetical protein
VIQDVVVLLALVGMAHSADGEPGPILLITAVAAVWTPTPPWCLAMVASIEAAVWVLSLYRRHS